MTRVVIGHVPSVWGSPYVVSWPSSLKLGRGSHYFYHAPPTECKRGKVGGNFKLTKIIVLLIFFSLQCKIVLCQSISNKKSTNIISGPVTRSQLSGGTAQLPLDAPGLIGSHGTWPETTTHLQMAGLQDTNDVITPGVPSSEPQGGETRVRYHRGPWVTHLVWLGSLTCRIKFLNYTTQPC